MLPVPQSNGRIALSTKTLEPEPGDMIKNPKSVFDNAEATAKKYATARPLSWLSCKSTSLMPPHRPRRYLERQEAEIKAREEAAKDIVMGLGDLDSAFASSADLDQVQASSLPG